MGTQTKAEWPVDGLVVAKQEMTMGGLMGLARGLERSGQVQEIFLKIKSPWQCVQSGVGKQ